MVQYFHSNNLLWAEIIGKEFRIGGYWKKGETPYHKEWENRFKKNHTWLYINSKWDEIYLLTRDSRYKRQEGLKNSLNVADTWTYFIFSPCKLNLRYEAGV